MRYAPRAKQYALIPLLLVCAASAAAQTSWLDSLSIQAQASVSAATNEDFNPLWLYSGEWGRYTQYSQAEGLVSFDAQLQLLSSRNVTIEAGIGAAANAKIKESYLHNAYLHAKIFMLDFDLGMRPYSMLAQNDDVTSGRMLFSSNARPLPRIGLGIYDWWSIPLTHNWLQIKGAFFVGLLPNEDNPRFTQDAVTHDKMAYARIGGWFLKPYIGLYHSVFMGGTHPTGGKMPVDFWASMLGKGSEKFRDLDYFRGEATNAAGAHMGMWSLGTDLDLPVGNFTFYFDKIFSDNAGIRLTDNMKDHAFGVVAQLRNKWVNRFGIEVFDTDYEGGDGVNDPMGYDKHGNRLLIYPGDMPAGNIRGWLLEHFEEEDIVAWEKKNYVTIDRENYGLSFLRSHWGCGDRGGRKTYLNNGLYFQGWSYNGLATGTPLYHSYQTVDKYRKGEGQMQNSGFFTNTRIRAITLAASGQIADKLSYRIKYTYSHNNGARQEKYIYGTFDTIKDYYYEQSRHEQYFLLDLRYQLRNHLGLRTTFAADGGELYNTFGMRAGVIYSFATGKK